MTHCKGCHRELPDGTGHFGYHGTDCVFLHELHLLKLLEQAVRGTQGEIEECLKELDECRERRHLMEVSGIE